MLQEEIPLLISTEGGLLNQNMVLEEGAASNPTEIKDYEETKSALEQARQSSNENLSGMASKKSSANSRIMANKKRPSSSGGQFSMANDYHSKGGKILESNGSA